jgi:hypothetical protein
MCANGEKGAQPSKNEFSKEIHKRGRVTLLGGRTTWGRGEELMREGGWRGIGMKQGGSGRLGKACQGIA